MNGRLLGWPNCKGAGGVTGVLVSCYSDVSLRHRHRGEQCASRRCR